jgi:hypothetical protein
MRHTNQQRITTFKTRTQAGARSAALPALLCAGIVLCACTTVGSGSGSVSPGGAPVTFAWKSTDGGSCGTMSATLAGQQTFSGRYLQITKQVRTEDFDPMWAGWQRGWNDWGGAWNDWNGWGGLPLDAFATQYTNRVMANLQAADGQRMRCTFHLNTPIDGMTGGGQGQCQLDNGRSVDAMFPAA